jgi:hypothetical protein
MRFDNPITDHGFNLPDVADFVDVKHEQRLTDLDCSVYLDKLKNYYSNNSLREFKSTLHDLLKKTEKEMPLADGEAEHIQKWKKRLFSLFLFTRNFEPNVKAREDTWSNIESNHWHDDLYENGFAPGHIKDTADIKHILGTEIDKLLNKPDAKTDIGSYDRSLPKLDKLHPSVLVLLQNKFKEAGILDGVKKFLKTKNAPRVTKATLHISKPSDTHLFHSYEDCKTISQTTNLHIDPKEGLVKALLYLDPVEDDNGPIWFVKTSHRWQYDPLETLFARGIATGCYFNNPTARRSVFRLPTQIRKSFGFGRCLQDGTPQQKLLLDNAVRITSNIGNVVLFDAGNVMHTGGWVKKHQRINLQIQITV